MKRLIHTLGSLYKQFIAVGAALALTITPLVTAPLTAADTVPPSGTPTTVSADALPTPQVNGIVWATAIRGNTVYATGKFSTATDTNGRTYSRNGLLAFNIATGRLTGFRHTLGGSGSYCRYGATTGAQGCALAISPDGSRLYVGGTFSTVDGQSHRNFAAINLTNNRIMSGFSGTNNTVRAVAATNTRAFIGGPFTAASGKYHGGLAAYTSSGSIIGNWNVTTRQVVYTKNSNGTYSKEMHQGDVNALVIAPKQQFLVIGGRFATLNGATFYSNGAVHVSSGKNVYPWASRSSSFPIRDQTPEKTDPKFRGTGITSLSTDGNQVYLTSFAFIHKYRPGTFEGSAAIKASDGSLVWLDDCEGDSYDAAPIGKVLYVAGHPHDCAAIGGFHDTKNPRTYQRAIAVTTYRTGVNGNNTAGKYYPKYKGQPRSTLLNWFPKLNTGTLSGASQGAWTVTGNSSYVVLGGEFTQVNDRAQQGLTRFGIKSSAPNKQGPQPYTGYAITANPANKYGKSTVRVYTANDPDNTRLTYYVYRLGGSKPIYTKTVTSPFRINKSFAFKDSAPVNRIHQYSLIVKDPFGNNLHVHYATIVNDTSPAVHYQGSGWKYSSKRLSRQDFGQNIHHTTVNGGSASYSFSGNSIRIIAERYPDGGLMRVSVDGKVLATVNLSSNSKVFKYYQQKVFSTDSLSSGRHTITVTKVGGKDMMVDGFAVN